MKSLLLLASLLLVVTSCQSEFELQLTEAKVLVQQEVKLQQKIANLSNFNQEAFHTLEKIQEELAIKSHLSDNQHLFKENLAAYKVSLQEQSEATGVYITKYP